MDALIINPGNGKPIYQGLAEPLTAIEPPTWARLLASYLRGKGANVGILDAATYGMGPALAADCVNNLNPWLAIVVVQGHQPSASTQTMPAAIEVCRAIKKVAPNQPILVVGGHPAALPGRTLIETRADFVCTGEGPITALQAVHFLRANGAGWRQVAARNILGVEHWGPQVTLDPINPMPYRDLNSYETHTDPAPNVWDLSEMLGNCWDMLPMERYRAHNWHAWTNNFERQPYASIYTSLGCPFACEFCCIQSPFKEGDALKFSGKANSYRLWPPDAVVGEIKNLVQNYGIRNLKICDEMYVLNRAHVANISRWLTETRLGKELNIWAYARVDTIKDDELLDEMRAAGVRWLALGIESMSDHVRDKVGKADYGHEDIIRACEKLRRHDICLMANFIFGLPDDTMESMEETFRLALEVRPDFVNFYSAMAYPGSALYDKAVKEGWPLPESWSGYSQHSYDCMPLRTKELTGAQVLAFRDEAFRRFFSDKDYQRHIASKFGPKAVAEVEEMLKVRLRRKLLGD